MLIHHKKLNKWISLGGHIKENETPDETVLREIKEEKGLDASFITLEYQKPFMSSYTKYVLQTPVQILHEYIPKYNEKPRHVHLDLIYVLQADEQELRSGGEESRWFTKDELEDLDMYKANKDMCLKLMK